MADNTISKSKSDRLAEKMKRFHVSEDDLSEQFILGSGKGGQKVNKTNSCVHLRHAASGIVIKCQESRSRAVNRFLARRELCDRLAEKIEGEKSLRRQRMEKIRRQKRRRSRRQKERMLEDKKKQSNKKKLRGPVGPDSH